MSASKTGQLKQLPSGQDSGQWNQPSEEVADASSADAFASAVGTTLRLQTPCAPPPFPPFPHPLLRDDNQQTDPTMSAIHIQYQIQIISTVIVARPLEKLKTRLSKTFSQSIFCLFLFCFLFCFFSLRAMWLDLSDTLFQTKRIVFNLSDVRICWPARCVKSTNNCVEGVMIR